MRRSWLVAGLSAGDEGKGAICDAIVRRVGASLVVRPNGGCQAAHNVITPEGRHHTFSQWASGTFTGARTWLSRHVVVDPLAMLNEAAHLKQVGIHGPFDLLTVDRECLVVTPYQAAMNRIRETARGAARHGSCGLGIGETVEDAKESLDHVLRIADLEYYPVLYRTLRRIQERKITQMGKSTLDRDRQRAHLELLFSDPEIWARRLWDAGQHLRISDRQGLEQACRVSTEVVFENSQGVLLDERHGFHPHTTWSNTTFDHAQTLALDADPGVEIVRIGVTRAYATRHGAGPFPTEDPALTAALPEPHNHDDPWQGPFRCGHLDLVLLHYALGACNGGVDYLAVTNVDRLRSQQILALATSYAGAQPSEPWPASYLASVQPHYHVFQGMGRERRFLDILAEEMPQPIGIVSDGPTAAAKAYVNGLDAVLEGARV